MSHNSRDDISVQQAAMEEEPKIELPRAVYYYDTEGKRCCRFSPPLTPRQKEEIHKKIGAIAGTNDFNDWTERTQVRLDELAKKLEI